MELKEETIMANNVQQLKEKPDKYKYRDKTTRVQLSSCILQVNTHCSLSS